MSIKSDTRIIAVFCDFENVALGVRDAKFEAFDIRKVLERLLLKGNIVVKKAYCDWQRYKEFKTAMHEAAAKIPPEIVARFETADKLSDEDRAAIIAIAVVD